MTLRRGIARTALIVGTSVATLAMPTGTASAAATRSDYAAQVNPICASASTQVEQINDQAEARVRQLARKGHKKGNKRNVIAAASKRKHGHFGSFDAFVRIYFQASEQSLAVDATRIAQIEQVAAAPGDETLVARWVANLHLIHDLTAQLIALSKQDLKQFKLFPHSAKDLKRQEKAERRRGRQTNRIYQQLETADDLDLELGTQLGATYCVTGATGVVTVVSGSSSGK